MKKNILYILFGAMLVFVVACESIEKRNELAPAISESQLLNYMDVKVSGNTVTCTNNAPGTIGFWKTSTGTQNNLKTSQFYFPLKNTYTITLTVYGGDKAVTVSKQVDVAQNDPTYFSDPMWNMLTNGTAGKTWVWAADRPGGKIWGNGGYLGDRAPGWWTLGVADIPGQGGSAGDEITFNLDKGMNFIVKMGPDGKPGSGSGAFDLKLGTANQLMGGDGKLWSYGKLLLSNHTIPLGFEPNTSGKPNHFQFDILKLTDDELVLAFPEPGVTSAWGTAWFYMFKRKGYTY